MRFDVEGPGEAEVLAVEVEGVASVRLRLVGEAGGEAETGVGEGEASSCLRLASGATGGRGVEVDDAEGAGAEADDEARGGFVFFSAIALRNSAWLPLRLGSLVK